MEINAEYKEIDCIKNLDSQYKERFFRIVDQYGTQLPERLVIEGSAYTMHDFNHHCINIYKIISEIILWPKIAYGNNGLSGKELFILDLAILFHDIGMNAFLTGGRKDHSRRSAEFIQEIYDRKDSVFRKESGLNLNELKALKLIVMAHSDIKDGSVPETINGLNNHELRNDMAAHVGKVRARFLASLLRLADELDITVERLGNGETESQLNDLKEEKIRKERELDKCENSDYKQALREEIEKIDAMIESLDHWERLHLFSTVDRNGEEVVIKVNDDHVRYCCEAGDTNENLVDRMFFVFRKIASEFKNGLMGKLEQEESAERKHLLKGMIAVESFTIKSYFPEINKLINERLNLLDPTDDTLVNSAVGNEGKEKLQPEVIDENYKKTLSGVIKRKHLLKMGHFLLDEIYCARDWIDTKEIIETQSIIDEIITCFTKHMNTHFDEEDHYLILGLDLAGAILASQVGMALQRPFSYLIPAKEINNNAGQDIAVEIEEYDKYVIFTDAIVTFETIEKVYESIGKNNKDYEDILQIYTIFYREPAQMQITKNSRLIKKTACISNEFTAELFEKAKCPYKDERCYAVNRKIK
mgnify:CR=1 FL=1